MYAGLSTICCGALVVRDQHLAQRSPAHCCLWIYWCFSLLERNLKEYLLIHKLTAVFPVISPFFYLVLYCESRHWGEKGPSQSDRNEINIQ